MFPPFKKVKPRHISNPSISWHLSSMELGPLGQLKDDVADIRRILSEAFQVYPDPQKSLSYYVRMGCNKPNDISVEGWRCLLELSAEVSDVREILKHLLCESGQAQESDKTEDPAASNEAELGAASEKLCN